MATLVESPSGKSSWLRQALKDTDRYWFAYGSATTIGVFRILMGFVNLANLILILPFVDAWYSERGFTPLATTDWASPPLQRDFLVFNSTVNLPFSIPRIDIFSNVTSSPVFLAIYWVVIVAAFLTMIGLWTRASSIILAIGIVSLQHRNLLILHGGDSIVRLGALYLAIAPSGKACSVDRILGLRKGKIKPGPALISIWPQRVIAFNLALIYFTTWWVKMDGERWRNGTATWFPSQLNEFHRFWVPPILNARWMIPIATYGTLVTELALGTIVFWKPARKWVLLAGLGLHGFIEYSMNIPLFAFGICSWYIAFFEGEEISAWARGIGARLTKWRLLVRAPRRTDLDSGPVHALEAADVFSLLTFEISEDNALTAIGPSGEDPNPTKALFRRTIGLWPLAAIPGLRRRLVNEAFPSVTKS